MTLQKNRNVVLRAFVIWYVTSFYMIILAIFIFCYGRILSTIRRQASVMAAHRGPGSSTAHAQTNQIPLRIHLL